MKFLILILVSILSLSAFASNESLFTTLSEFGKVEDSLGGKSFVELHNVICMRRLGIEVTFCDLKDSSEKDIALNGDKATRLLDELQSAGAASYSGSGIGKSYYETKKVSCLRSLEFSNDGEPLNSFTFSCSAELKLYGIE